MRVTCIKHAALLTTVTALMKRNFADQPHTAEPEPIDGLMVNPSSP